MEYRYDARTERGSKTVTVSSPFKWMLSYSGFTPGKLTELREDPGKYSAEIQAFILHSLVLNVVVSRQQGVSRMLDALHFPVSSEKTPASAGLPLTRISSCVSTIRPPDEVIIESTEVSGTDAFEEVVNLDDLGKIREPLKEQLVGLVKSEGGGLPAA